MLVVHSGFFVPKCWNFYQKCFINFLFKFVRYFVAFLNLVEHSIKLFYVLLNIALHDVVPSNPLYSPSEEPEELESEKEPYLAHH
jgi:hypothetical protein